VEDRSAHEESLALDVEGLTRRRRSRRSVRSSAPIKAPAAMPSELRIEQSTCMS
jgi:hypothetical protein